MQRRQQENRRQEWGEAAARLKRLIPAILGVWAERVRAAIPAAQDRELPVLLDHLPKFLNCLAEIMGGKATLEALPAEPSSARAHGAQRAHEEFPIQDVFEEYALLRGIIMELMEAEAPLSLEFRMLLQQAIDRGVQDAAIQHSEISRRALEASEARLRRLQSISDVALAPLPLDELLRELLHRIYQTLSVDGVTILLREDDLLTVRASKGLEEELTGQVQVPLGKGVSGRIAATGKMLNLPDLKQAEVVSSPLRERATSLLGVPLVIDGEVIGVLHVSSCERRCFTDEEAQFLCLVADRVALAVDRARLTERLQAANEQLKAADRRKDEFLAMLAHELRSPLSAVMTAADVLKHIQVDERALRQLEAIKRQSQHLARLVEDLMDVSRISQGKIELHRQPVELLPIAREAADVVHPFIEARGQELICSFPSEHLLIDGDPTRLQQIIANLLTNAAKYSEPGSRVWLALEREPEQAVVRVRDEGIGIDPVVLPTLFDLFVQVDPSERQSHGGLGIGLHLVKRLVDIHGGTITTHSEGLRQGTEFLVRLPLLQRNPIE